VSTSRRLSERKRSEKNSGISITATHVLQNYHLKMSEIPLMEDATVRKEAGGRGSDTEIIRSRDLFLKKGVAAAEKGRLRKGLRIQRLENERNPLPQKKGCPRCRGGQV